MGTVNAAERVALARDMGISNAEHVSPIDMEKIGQRTQSYGTTPGQLGAMPSGSVDAVVSSPPYEGSVNSQQHGIDWEKAGPATGNRKRGDGTKHEETLNAQLNYGAAEGQLGNETGTTFWSAARQIVAECHAILKPGGVAVWVCKDFVRNKARVPFSADWVRLCESQGFRLVGGNYALAAETCDLHSLVRNAPNGPGSH